jgi:uncharacterized protein (DUF924 family)
MPTNADFPSIGTDCRHVVCHARRERVHWLSDPLKRVGGDVVVGGLPRSIFDEVGNAFAPQAGAHHTCGIGDDLSATDLDGIAR